MFSTRCSLLLILLGLGAGKAAVAQNEEDALRYSNTLPGGTARSWAMGSAFGAVGADPSSASLNPAGFGLYNTSELSFTPAFEVNDARALHYGTSASDNDSRFHFNNLSLMLSYPNKNGSDWRSGVFGISYDRQASFHWAERAVGDQVNSSILQQFAQQAQGIDASNLPDQLGFGSDLAYETYGIDPSAGDSLFYESAIPAGTPVKQVHTINTKGRLNTTSFFYATNYMDRLYIGASLGLVGARYERHIVHTETVADAPDDALKSVTYKENLLTTGSGIDLKVGVVGRVTDQLRLGLSFHSPMWMMMSDAYSSSMNTSFTTPDPSGNTDYSYSSPDGSFNYRVRTPWRVLASAAYVVGKNGLISVDYEYANFRQAKLNNTQDLADDYDFSAENDIIRNDFRPTHSLRAGTEWRAGKVYFRGGAGIWPSAYADNDARQGTAYMRYSGGVGYRSQHFSLDFALVYGTQDINYFQYDPSLVQVTTETQHDTRGMLTFAFRP